MSALASYARAVIRSLASVPTWSAVTRAARSWALAASRVSLAACVRTRRPVVFDGVVRVALARRAEGLRAAGLRFAAAGFFAVVVVLFVVVLAVFSAML